MIKFNCLFLKLYSRILAHLWYTNVEKTAYGNAENVSMLGMAYRALYANDALIGVAGVEFLYDTLVERMKKLGCNPEVSPKSRLPQVCLEF